MNFFKVRFNERANMKKFEIEVDKAEGYCSCGYTPGDKFHSEGLKIPGRVLKR
jgi:hypothetical protein